MADRGRERQNTTEIQVTDSLVHQKLAKQQTN
jgi:hypothetical protein